MLNTLYIHTFGCQMNVYDSARIADLLHASHGLTLTARPEDADVLLVNTCSIRAKARDKVFSLLGRWRPWKSARPELIVGVGGCVASQEGAAVRERAPFVDLIFGPQTLHRLPRLLDAARRGSRPQCDLTFPALEKFAFLPPPRATGPSAAVTIMEGCARFCTYCVVPYTRGPEYSRPVAAVLAEVGALAAQGVREVLLLGQNVNAYRGLTDDGAPADLAALIRRIAAIPGIGRIRFVTSHPVEFSDALIAAYAEVPQLAAHLHLPVQSGADRILAAMGRGHTADDYRAKIRRLRSARPEISISSDFIVGFPGETDDDFAATLRLIEDIGFDRSFSFIYSPRPGTPAASYADPVPRADKQARLERLQRLIEQQAQRIGDAMIGSVQRVLVEGLVPQHTNRLIGRSENQRAVHFTGSPAWIGRFVIVRIEAARPHVLYGQPLDAPASCPPADQSASASRDDTGTPTAGEG